MQSREGAFLSYPGSSAPSSPTEAPRNHSESAVSLLSTSIVDTYTRCSPDFQYAPHIPRPVKILTKPSEPSTVGGYDNINDDLIVAVDDVFVSPLGIQYTVCDMLGQGTFGQVFKCTSNHINQVAIKIIKNQAAYYHQARVEIGILQFLNTKADPQDQSHIVRLKDFFLHKSHLCLVFELLSLNLFELVKHNKFRGLSLALVRVFTRQVLESLALLRHSSIIHCDIKPENILLANATSGEVKLIDFGSACFSNRTVYSYIQSRFYRSPEVVLGHQYTMAVDMWSLGCVAAELFLGLPLFPAACELDLLQRINETIGTIPARLLMEGKNTAKFYEDVGDCADENGGEYRRSFRLRTAEEFTSITGHKAPKGKQYFKHTALADIISAYPLRSGLTDEEISKERASREIFTDFLMGLFDLDPSTRWTPRQAQQHPFVSGAVFTGPFQPLSSDHHGSNAALGAVASTALSQQQQQQPGQSSSSSSSSSMVSPAAPMTIPINKNQPIEPPRSSTVIASTAVRDTIDSTTISTTSTSSYAAKKKGTAPHHQALNSTFSTSSSGMLASSPQVHAHAHAVGVAAVQRHMSLQQQQHQQQQQQQSMQFLGSSQYVPAHSLQRIVGQHMPIPGKHTAAPPPPTTTSIHTNAISTAGPSDGLPHLSSSLPPPMFTPPSRSFGFHIQQDMLAHDTLPPPSFDASGDHRLVPLLQLPMQSSARPPSPSLPSSSSFGASFQPSSVRTFHSVLAAVDSRRNGFVNTSSVPSHAGDGDDGRPSIAAAMKNMHLGGGNAGAVDNNDNNNSAGIAAIANNMANSSGDGSDGAIHNQYATSSGSLGLPLSVRDGAMNGGDGTSGGEGSVNGTPQKERSANFQEDVPNPADWDPLWSDDLLHEDEGDTIKQPRSSTLDGMQHQKER